MPESVFSFLFPLLFFRFSISFRDNRRQTLRFFFRLPERMTRRRHTSKAAFPPSSMHIFYHIIFGLSITLFKRVYKFLHRLKTCEFFLAYTKTARFSFILREPFLYIYIAYFTTETYQKKKNFFFFFSASSSSEYPVTL